MFHSDGDIRALMPALSRAGYSAVHLGGLGPEAFAAAVVAARALGLAVAGGIEAVVLGTNPRHAGEVVGRLARAGRVLVCDDGGMTRAEEVTAYATALRAARDAFGEGSGGQ